MNEENNCKVGICTPRRVQPENIEKAAKTALKINPLNRPNGIKLYKRLGRMPTPAELTLAVKKYWGVEGVRLTVGFLDNPTRELRNRILSHLNAWNKKANIEFVEIDCAEDAEVRINRERMGDPLWDGYWSFLGTDIIDNQGPNNQTMNLEAFTMNTPDSEFYRVVRHEAGHTLGFHHEHLRKELVKRIDRAKAIEFYGILSGWTEQDVDFQVLTPIEGPIIETENADETSIMAYHVPSEITIDGFPIHGGDNINDIDHNFASLIYPK